MIRPLLISLILFLGFEHAIASPVIPRSNAEVQTSLALPTAPICDGISAFGVQLGATVPEDEYRILQKDVKWQGKATVTEFEPSREYKPYTRFFFLRTPLSRKVVWVLGAAFYDSPSLANEATLAIVKWYGQALGTPLRPGYVDGSYMLRKNGFNLDILLSGNTVRVSCEHFPTSSQNLKELVQGVQ
jgi:hypothetical protein